MPRKPSIPRIKPRGPEAVTEILLKRLYGSQEERIRLVYYLLYGGSHAHCLAQLIQDEQGRQCLEEYLYESVEQLALDGSIPDCMVTYEKLPVAFAQERLRLLGRIASLGPGIADSSYYQEKFAASQVLPAERALLAERLGHGLVARLLRADAPKPRLRIA